jgi:hypothetical protein
MQKTRFLAATCLVLFATQAQAAKCYIREYNTIGQAQNQPAQIALEPAVTDQVTTDFASAAVQSAFFNAATTYVRLWCDTQGSFLVGTNPTAAATNAPVAAGVPEYFGVPVGGTYRLSVHSNP